MNKSTILKLTAALLILLFSFIWSKINMTTGDTPWWITALSIFVFCLVVLFINNYLLRQHFSEQINNLLEQNNTQIEQINKQIEQRILECPARKEQLLATCLPTEDSPRHSDAFRRSFQAANPTFLLQLREQIPSITPGEEMLCMLIKMGLNNKEAADRMSVSLGSLHTIRYRFRRKLPPEIKEEMDEWIKQIE